MFFAWLKQYTPRGLYGRAALILLVPIVTLLAVISVVFVQRLFEEVTRQLTTNSSIAISYVLDGVGPDQDPDQAQARARALDIALELSPDAVPTSDLRNWTDLSGREVIRVLRADLPEVVAVDLVQNRRQVVIYVARQEGAVRLTMNRRRFSAANPHQFLVLMAFVAIVMSVIAIIFLRNQLRPIKRLAQAAEAFGRGRIEPYRPSGALEVRSAGNAFLDMRARLERQIEQRTMMLSGVSHDLRTPLTRMKLALSMMDDRLEAQDLTRDVEEMERLLDEFLAFARGDALDDLNEIDVVQLIRDVAARFGRDKVALDPSCELPVSVLMQLRPMAIERALSNLLGNAMRYADTAVIGISSGAKSVTLWVEDDGPGIAEDKRDDALKPFVRLDAARNQDRGSGVGLGLAITNDIARRHGGMLRLRDGEKLGGLRVEIVLPR